MDQPSFDSLQPSPARVGIRAYLVAAGFVGLATLARLALDPELDGKLPFITFFAAVVAAAWYGGFWSALFSLALSCLAADWFFISPRYSLAIESGDWAMAAGLIVFLIVGLAIAGFTEALNRSRRIALSQREWLRVTLSSIGDAVIATTEQGRVSFMNSIAEELTGWPTKEAVGQPLQNVFRIINEQTRAPVEDPAGKVLRTGIIVGLANHTVLIRRDGIERPIDDSAAPIQDAEGRVLGVVLVFRNATDQRRAQEVTQRLAAIVEHSDDAIIGKRLDGTITSWNAAAERMYGIKAQEAIGKSIQMVVPDDRVGELDQIMARIRAGERIEHLDTVRLRKDGTRIDVSLTVSPIKNFYGEVIGVSKIARDITERKRIDRQKDEFLAMLSHELRNPIAAIAYAAQLCKMTGADVPEAADIIERQVRQLSRLIDDLLDVSRLTRNKVQLKKEMIDAATLARRAAATVQPMLEQNGHEFSFDLAHEEMPLFVDPTRIEQILVNLLTNAVKYTPQGGKIRLSAHPHDGQIIFQVKDTGIGIPSEMLPRVFELFTQLDPTLDRSQGGLGIGLTVVRQLAEMHGGSVSATSEGPGKGSEFVIRLPSGRDNVPSNATTALPPTIRRGLKVLIVEDDVDTAQSIACILENMGCSTQMMHDGTAVLKVALSFRPDVVLLDIGLPGLNGYQVAQQIRQNEALAHTRLIAISGYGQPPDKDRSKNAGFDDHLVKPVELESLVARLAQ